MTIYFVMKNLFPNGKASTARVRCYTKGLTSYNIACKVILPIPLEKNNDPHFNTQVEGQFNGVYFKNMSGTLRRSKNIITRQFIDLKGYINTLWYLIKTLQKEDIVIVYEGGSFWHRIVANVTHLKRCKVVMELNELPYGTSSQNNKTARKRERMLKKVFPKFDMFLTISESLTRLAKQYSPHSAILKVPILVEDVNINSTTIIKEPYIFHSGTLTEQKDGILGIIEAFGIACKQLNKPLKYYMTGNLTDSPHAAEITQLIQKYHLEEKIIFTGYLNNNELITYQKNCLFTIINKYDTLQNKYCFSTKLGEYLAFKKPVIITQIGEAMNYLQNNINAYIIPPHNINLLADKIIEIVNNPQKSQHIGNEGYKLTQTEFNCMTQAKKIINFLSYNNQ